MIVPPPPSIVAPLYQELVGFLGLLHEGARAYWRGGGGAITPTSWWRSVDHNAAVGGHPESQHLLGLAADLAVEAQRIEELGQALRRATLVVVPYERHVHVQYHPAGFLRDIGWRVTDGGELLDQRGNPV